MQNPNDRADQIGDYLAKLDDAKRTAAKLGWRGDMAKIDEMIAAASLACADTRRPALLGAIGPFLACSAGMAL